VTPGVQGYLNPCLSFCQETPTIGETEFMYIRLLAFMPDKSTLALLHNTKD
jgi:hypothetical protein